MIREYLRTSWLFWTKDARFVPVRRAAVAVMGPGATLVEIYFMATGYWTLGVMTGAIGGFCLYRWYRLR